MYFVRIKTNRIWNVWLSARKVTFPNKMSGKYNIYEKIKPLSDQNVLFRGNSKKKKFDLNKDKITLKFLDSTLSHFRS